MNLIIVIQLLMLCFGLYFVIKGADVLLSSADCTRKKVQSLRLFHRFNYYWLWYILVRIISFFEGSFRKLAKFICWECYWLKYFKYYSSTRFCIMLICNIQFKNIKKFDVLFHLLIHIIFCIIFYFFTFDSIFGFLFYSNFFFIYIKKF